MKAREALASKIHKFGNAENESLGIEIGYGYVGSSIIHSTAEDVVQNNPLVYQPTTTPGYRPPAIYVKNEQPIFNLFGSGFSLLNFSPDDLKIKNFEQLAQQLQLPLKVVNINDEHAKSIYDANLVIIRPDQHIAWRDNNLPENIGNILKIISGH